MGRFMNEYVPIRNYLGRYLPIISYNIVFKLRIIILKITRLDGVTNEFRSNNINQENSTQLPAFLTQGWDSTRGA